MKRFIPIVVVALSLSTAGRAHDVITTKLTWNREISRIAFSRCVSCHHPGGRAFSLMTYKDARPWAIAIKEEVLSRRMPPWGAVKGFGNFRNDNGLTGEQIEWITAWVVGGAPEGEADDLEKDPKIPQADPPVSEKGGVVVSGVKGDYRLTRDFVVDGIVPRKVPDQKSLQITAALPDGSVEPLLWLYEYKAPFAHPFLLRTPLKLPRGTMIEGVPKESTFILLPAPKSP